MKKSLFFCSALAVLALVSSCKKEQETVTLGVSIEQDAKMYINSDRTPYWNAGDQVYVNDLAYTIANPSGGSAQIPNVTSSRNYCAIFPASIVPTGSNISSGTFNVTLPERQKYEIVDGHQRVEIPMAGVTSSTSLSLHNLASILRVEVSNSTSAAVAIKSITVTANNAYLSGAATATISGGTTDNITASSNGSHSVTLAKADNTAMATIAASTTTPSTTTPSTFDVILPTFNTASTITVKVETTTGYQEFSTTNTYTLTNNQIISFAAPLSSITQYTTANLVTGPTFRNAIPSTATAVLFEYNKTKVTSGTLLSTTDSPNLIYGNLVDGTWVVSTSADCIYANSYSSQMFRGTYNSSTSSYESNLISIDFGSGFNTSSVTDMSYMFNGCIRLTGLNLSNFNTSSVTDMKSMFNQCNSLTSLDLSNFNTSSVTNMQWMFFSCSGLTDLDVSNFNTSSVTDMQWMFCSCSGLTDLDVSNFNTSSVTDMALMFASCKGLTGLNLSNFNTSSVTNMRYMFYKCSGLTNLNLYNFNMTAVTDKYYMCTNLATTSGTCTITCPTAVQTAMTTGNTQFPTSGVNFIWQTH